MNIKIYPIVSSLHDGNVIATETKDLLGALATKLEAKVDIVGLEDLYTGDLALILVQSGGSEGEFLHQLPHLKAPYYLLTYGYNNSLAASLEILSYLKDHDLPGEVLHGTLEYLVERITKLTPKYRYGVLGQPSDWLIASKVNYSDVLTRFGIELVNVDLKEVEKLYEQANLADFQEEEILDFDLEELNKAKKLYLALLAVKNKYNLSGLTIRCFDLLTSLKTTACLGLAFLNKHNIVGTCEGDIPSMLSMHILNEVLHMPGFQANPSRIDVANGKMVLAHCTLPFSMPKSYTLDTHFESGIGVAVRAKMNEGEITILKISADLKQYFLTTGKIVKNLSEDNLCRTQIELEVKGLEYFLTRPFGNHHVVVYGNHERELETYLNGLGLIRH